MAVSQVTQDVDSVLGYCWPSVFDAVTAISQHWVSISYFLGTDVRPHFATPATFRGKTHIQLGTAIVMSASSKAAPGRLYIYFASSVARTQPTQDAGSTSSQRRRRLFNVAPTLRLQRRPYEDPVSYIIIIICTHRWPAIWHSAVQEVHQRKPTSKTMFDYVNYVFLINWVAQPLNMSFGKGY